MEETHLKSDSIELLHGALIQHGSFNNRIYLMKIKDAGSSELVPALLKKAQANSYTKILVKIPRSKRDAFLDAGFQKEAKIPNFYSGMEDALFMSYYLSAIREKENNIHKVKKVYQLSKQKQVSKESVSNPSLDKRFSLRHLRKDDIPKIAQLYGEVFPSYPFPIHDPSYLLKTMESHVDYFGIEIKNQLVALSSLEKDMENKNAEMTDFATLSNWRNHGFAKYLLVHMENEARHKGIITAYTISRAESPGMNITFTQNAYQYGGRLINNTNISGHIESMNIWYKAL